MRRLLVLTLGLGVAIALPSGGRAVTLGSAPDPARWLGAASAEGDPLLDPLAAELARVMTVSLRGGPAPYFVAFDVTDGRALSIEAQLGGLVWDDDDPVRKLGVAVRVGGPELDNGNFDHNFEGDGFDDAGLVHGDDPRALRHDAWLLADRCFKDAVENRARKEAHRRSRVGTPPPPDFASTVGQRADLGAAPPHDAAALRELARGLSARFLAHPDVLGSSVTLSGHAGRRVALDSGGTRVSQPWEELTLRVVASARADDGRRMTDHATWIVRRAEQLPDRATLEAEVDALAARLEAWRSVPAATDEYVGPVVFEGAAAIELFRQLLVAGLSGTPPVERSKDAIGRDEEEGGPLTLKRRALPPGWTVDDDPTADPTLPSSFPYDDEGVPAERVALIDDGVVRGLLMSRVPARGLSGTNGHARGDPGDLMRGMPSWTRVVPPRALPARRVSRQGLALARQYDLDRVLVIRRLRDPSLEEDRFSFTMRFGGWGAREVPPGLSAPVEAVLRDRDGHEEPVSGLVFSGVDRRVLRDIVAAGPSTTASIRVVPGASPWRKGVPVTLTAPTVLVAELQLVPEEAEAEQRPPVESPLR